MGEGTGHVDMYVHIVGPARAIVGEYTEDQDAANKQATDTGAQMLEEAGYTVTRVPMPDNDNHYTFRSYTNALAVEDVVLVPVYDEDQTGEAEALEAFEEAYAADGREWEMVPMDSDAVIRYAGAIHCITMTVAEQDR